ncbi:Rhodanese-like protein [Blastocystis hominis]|uniref:Rhodanese-like protein n=1 Tax=Blastocystis hominis TaxID=12968 RepID=D8LYM0_BLAHO|nr:Rhodanese-like protein [Blastocystis hominis]CBK20675.2 Rhodanese-like protein [Blastocystis hominis]|eukprot:XP_012894723.1 Rhodanese-like protein [Blastocystis hominis]
MLGTTIYRRDRLRRLIVIALLAFVAYTLLLRPVKSIREVNVKLGKDGGSSIETLEVEEPESEMLAEEISAEELYIIRTRSNEYILIVDARSKEEFDEAHISGALPLEKFEKTDFDRFPKIRVFFYSNHQDRSKETANYYASRGIKAIYLKGGLTEWDHEQRARLVERSSL